MKALWEKVFQYALGAIVIISFFVTLILMIVHAESVPENSPVLYSMVGVLGTIATAVVMYFFGSSKGSADKNDMIKGKMTDAENKTK